MSTASASILGLDGTRTGWAVAWWNGEANLTFHPTFENVLEAFPEAIAIGIDIPIGLTAREPRLADAQVRRAVGPRYRSVFPAPCRPAIEQPDRSAADRVSRALGGPGIGAQAFALAGKIREVDVHSADPHLHEVHPELSFATMKGAHLSHTKRTYAGVRERLALIQQHLGEPDVGIAGGLPIDDVLDALAVLWSARRIAAGTSLRYPAEPTQTDPLTGRDLCIRC